VRFHKPLHSPRGIAVTAAQPLYYWVVSLTLFIIAGWGFLLAVHFPKQMTQD